MISLLVPLAILIIAVFAVVLAFAMKSPRVRTILLVTAAAGLWTCLVLVALAWMIWF
ncbi:MAG TPA: hypothetical protein VMP03_13840 [Methylomirabilota bacterium]|nr:hypothetical protein [Methylomirabilota bacterium]